MGIFIITKEKFKNYALNLHDYLVANFTKEVYLISSKDSLSYVKDVVRISKEIVANDFSDRLILIDETGGLGFCAGAKVKKMVIAQCADEHSAHMTREHNNAIGISLGANITNISIAKEIARLFLETKFAAGRHMIRIDMLNKLA